MAQNFQVLKPDGKKTQLENASSMKEAIKVSKLENLSGVAASSVLLIVLSAFAGLKDFGLAYTSSFDPDLKIVPETGSYFILKDEGLGNLEGMFKDFERIAKE